MAMTPLKRPKIACIGAAHWDRLASLASPLKMHQLNSVSTQRVPSGASLNTAMDLSVLGFPVKLLSVLGNDQEAKELLRALNQSGVDTGDMELLDESGTGWSTTLVCDDGNIQFGLADLSLYQALDEAWLKSHLTNLEEWRYWIVDNHVQSDALEMLCKQAKEVGTQLFAAADSAALVKNFLPILPALDGLFLNRVEAEILLDRELASTKEAKEAASDLLAQGAKLAVITLGPDGLVYGVQDRSEIRHIETLPANVVNVSGAGDALTAGTVASISLGNDIDCAIIHGIHAAKASVETFTNVNQGMTPQLIDEFFAKTEAA